MTVELLIGAAFGLGIVMVVAGLTTAPPNLRAAVLRSHQSSLSTGARVTGWVGISETFGHRLGLARHAADLRLAGLSIGQMAAQKAGYALVGLAFPCLLAAMLIVLGLPIPFGMPAFLGLLLGAGMSFIPEIDLRRRVRASRGQMRRTVCVYLELVALERAADAGAVEAMERAAAIGDGPGFEHIRQALLRARLEGRTPWQQLSALGDELRVPELTDLADIMRLSGEDGAAVLPTLRARAASLRGQLLQAEVAAANEASERMSIPVALLAVAFMGLIGFPAISRILFG